MVKIHARIERRSVPLSNSFGYRFACFLFGAAVIDALPKIEAGRPNAGQPRGCLNWDKAHNRGWSAAYGRIVDAGLVWAHITVPLFGNKSTAIRADWMGQVRPLSASGDHLGDEGRARLAAEQAAWQSRTGNKPADGFELM